MPLANADEQPEHIRHLLTRPETLNLTFITVGDPAVV